MATENRHRLLVVASTYPRWHGDTEPRFVHDLSRRLTHAFDVTVITPHADGALRHEVLDGVQVIRFRYAPNPLQQLAYKGGILANLRGRRWTWLLLPGFLFAMARAVAHALRNGNFDVVHAHWLVPQAWIVISVLRLIGLRNVPVLATSHGGDLFALKGRAGTLMKRHALMRASHVTVVSHAMKREAGRIGADLSKVTVAPMGVDARNRFTPEGAQRDKRTVLFVGRLVEKKGVDVLLRAFAQVLAIYQNARLRIVGNGPCRERLETLAKSLQIESHVDFSGAVPHRSLPNVYRQATAFVMPSVETRDGDQEGFGLVLAEAMSCGCAVIASDLKAIRDVIGEEGGILFPSQDHTSLANEIVKVLRDESLREALGKRARDRALKNFDWAICTNRYLGLLQSLAKTNGSVIERN